MKHVLLPGAVAAALLCSPNAFAQGPPVGLCNGTTITEKCIVSVTTTSPSTPALLSANVSFSSSTGGFTVNMVNNNNGGADKAELTTGTTITNNTLVTVVFRLAVGGTDPKRAISTGVLNSWSVNTAVSPHQVTFTANPRSSSWSLPSLGGTGCTPSSCATTANKDYSSFLVAGFDPMLPPPGPPVPGFAEYSARAQGGFVSTNAQFFSNPQYNPTTKSLFFQVGAPHFKVGGATLNSGFVRVMVPEAVLTDLWGIAGGSGALAANLGLTSVTVGGSPASFAVQQVAGGALIQIGESTPFSYSVPQIILGPVIPIGPAPPPPPPLPTAYPPSFVRGISDQTMMQNTSLAVPFSISGAVIPNALGISIASSNTTLLPVAPSTVAVSCTDGACSLQLTPEDGHSGTAVLTVNVTDGYYTTSTSFTLTVVTVRPPPPAVVLASAVGSTIVVTWAPSEGGTPNAYAVGWGTSSGASDLPAQLVAGTSTRYEFSALPAGTYFFRIYAVGAGDSGGASSEVSATVVGSTAPGPPAGLIVLNDSGGLTANWSPSTIGAAPAIYEVHVGSALGQDDVASVTTTALSLNVRTSSGSYWVQTRGTGGGSLGEWSSSVQVRVGSVACTDAPAAPVLLPVAAAGGRATFTWWPRSDTATSYQIQISSGAGLAPSMFLSTPGSGTSVVWGPVTGSFAARAVAINSCGTSARSNEVAFDVR